MTCSRTVVGTPKARTRHRTPPRRSSYGSCERQRAIVTRANRWRTCSRLPETFAWTRPTDEVLADPAPSDTENFSPAGMDGLRHAIALLTAEDREVLELRFDQELTFAEIGRVMGISRFAARRRLDGALAALRELLKSGEEDVK